MRYTVCHVDTVGLIKAMQTLSKDGRAAYVQLVVCNISKTEFLTEAYCQRILSRYLQVSRRCARCQVALAPCPNRYSQYERHARI